MVRQSIHLMLVLYLIRSNSGKAILTLNCPCTAIRTFGSYGILQIIEWLGNPYTNANNTSTGMKWVRQSLH